MRECERYAELSFICPWVTSRVGGDAARPTSHDQDPVSLRMSYRRALCSMECPLKSCPRIGDVLTNHPLQGYIICRVSTYGVEMTDGLEKTYGVKTTLADGADKPDVVRPDQGCPLEGDELTGHPLMVHILCTVCPLMGLK